MTTWFGLDASSTIFIVTWCPSSPPWALTTLPQQVAALAAFPGSEKSPENDSEIPIVIGPAALCLDEAPAVAAAVVATAASASSKRTALEVRLVT